MDRMHPIIRQCIHQLTEIESDEKTRQIVYMYLKSLQSLYEEDSQEEIDPMIRKCIQHLKVINADDHTCEIVIQHINALKEYGDREERFDPPASSFPYHDTHKMLF
ncbi:hypothetical protein QTG56_20630 [Rossellomorea sp. AcN35-11]|nr:hypothetical protein [Rossellomorea aquimaris]NMH69617.1 hypothetical protein [Bacillus sp. RO3]WJV29328.1 hypothetical protein QTG56_20630 [Rossellomorea sp. AcN35-11]